MDMNNAQIINLAAAVEPPADGIISRTIFNDDGLKAVVFGFGTGQELSEHTASVTAVMHFLSGEADVTLHRERQAASAGTWVHMPAGTLHSIVAKTPTTMLLLLWKKDGS
jgi:quercetin dioxygenase-like cupin family protein